MKMVCDESLIHFLRHKVTNLEAKVDQIKKSNYLIIEDLPKIRTNLDLLLIESRKLENKNWSVRSRAEESIKSILVIVKITWMRLGS